MEHHQPKHLTSAPAQQLTVLSGPTAVGKGTVSRELLRLYPEVGLLTSATTRPPRPGEVDGQHYHFLSHQEFDDRVRGGEFLEWAVVHGENRYGTLISEVDRALEEGKVPFLEIDVAGARQVRERHPEARLVFLRPPSEETLWDRLIGRGTESQEDQMRRMRTAKLEMSPQTLALFDHQVVNEYVESAVEEIARIMGLAAR